MNITELQSRDRVIISRNPAEKEVATIQSVLPDGHIRIFDAKGDTAIITPEQILKKFPTI